MYELFSTVGHVNRVIMGLDRIKKTPCGFCFVVSVRPAPPRSAPPRSTFTTWLIPSFRTNWSRRFDDHKSAVACKQYISGMKLDDRVIRCELDSGFIEGRQFGRGTSGGQVRDERRSDYDAGRGGYGTQVQTNVSFPQMAGAAGEAEGAAAAVASGEELTGGSADVELPGAAKPEKVNAETDAAADTGAVDSMAD